MIGSNAATDENNEKVQRVLDVRTALLEDGNDDRNSSFSKVKLAETLGSRISYFRHQDTSTVLKWINMALGFVGPEMKEALELFIKIGNQGKGKGMVWEVIERQLFVGLNCVEKIIVLKVMMARHLYRTNLAARLRSSKKTKNARKKFCGDIPPGSGPQDKITRWFGEECKELLVHVQRLSATMLQKLTQRQLPFELMTKGEFTFDDFTTSEGLAGMLAFLYEDIPGPKSLRTARYPMLSHSRILLTLLENYNIPEDSNFSSDAAPGEEQVRSSTSTESVAGTPVFIPSEHDVGDIGDNVRDKHTEGLRNGCEEKKKNHSSPNTENKRGRRGMKTVPGWVRNGATDILTETSDDSQHLSSPETNRGIRQKLSSQMKTNLSNKNNPFPLPQKKPRGLSITKKRKRLAKSGRLKLPAQSARENSSHQHHDESEVVLASGTCSVPPILTLSPNNSVPRQLVGLEETCLPSTKDEAHRNKSYDTLVGQVVRDYELAVEDLIRKDPEACIPKKIQRIDETISGNEMDDEIIPPAIAPNAFARRLGIKWVRSIERSMNNFIEKGPFFDDCMDNDDVGLKHELGAGVRRKMFFKQKRIELEEKGFIILEGLLKPESDSFPLNPDSVFNYVEDNFTDNPMASSRSEETRREMDPTKLWVPIFNDKPSIRQDIRSPAELRYQTWPWKIRDGLPTEIQKQKSGIDILAGFIVRGLYPPCEVRDSRIRQFAFPEQGSIFLRTCERTPSQSPHCDFPPVEPDGVLPFHEPPPLHSMFIMYSAPQPFAIRLWRTSHIEMNVKTADDTSLLPIARNMRSKLERVPPYSMLVSRGDLLHAGASGKELLIAFQDYKGITDADRKNGEKVFINSKGLNCNTGGHLYATRGDYVFDGVFRTIPDFPARIIDDNLQVPL